MSKESISRRGVYRDLSQSPYEYITPYGDMFKFPSQKKLEIYSRDVQKEIDRITKIIDRLELSDYIPGEIIHLLYRMAYRSFYRKIGG